MPSSILSNAQLTILGNLFNSDSTYTGHSSSDDGAFELANLLNADSTISVYRTTTLVADVEDAILGTKYTPVDVVSALNAVTMTANLLICQCKQMNLQILMQGKDIISSGKPNVRAWLQDSCTGIPSGAGGALVGAGYATVKTIMTRLATKAEALFFVSSVGHDGTVAFPGDLVYEGVISVSQVQQARALVGVS